MIALLLLLAMAAIYVGTIETAFTALMRLSLRLPSSAAAATIGSGSISTIPFSSSCLPGCCSASSSRSRPS